MLLVHVDEGREQARSYPPLAAVQLSLLTHEAITGDWEPAIPLAGVCTLLYLGADLLDNLADDELPPRWAPWGPQQASLAAATFLAVLVPMALARMPSDDGMHWSFVGMFAEGMLEMSAGQRADLTEPGEPGPRTRREMVERKSGTEMSVFARAGAVLADANRQEAEAYAAFGLSLGSAAQVASDVHDLFHPEGSRDLLNERITLPVAHALARLSGRDLAQFRALLASARRSVSVHADVREALMATRSIVYSSVVVEAYLARARRSLARARPREPAASALLGMVEALSLFRADGLAAFGRSG